MRRPSWARWSRVALGAAGVLALGYAVIGALTDPRLDLTGWAVFLGATLVVHDGLVLPVALAVGALCVRLLPPPARGPVITALLASATLTAVALPALVGRGRSADDPSLLPRDYPLGLGALLAVVWLGAAVVVVRRMRRDRPATRSGDRPGTPLPSDGTERTPTPSDGTETAAKNAAGRHGRPGTPKVLGRTDANVRPDAKEYG